MSAPLPPVVTGAGGKAARVLRTLVDYAVPPQEPVVRKPGLRPRGFRDFIGLGPDTLRTAMRSATSMASLAVLGSLALLLCFVVGKVGVWSVILVSWVGIAAVFYRLRGRLDWSRVSRALRDDEEPRT